MRGRACKVDRFTMPIERIVGSLHLVCQPERELIRKRLVEKKSWQDISLWWPENSHSTGGFEGRGFSWLKNHYRRSVKELIKWIEHRMIATGERKPKSKPLGKAILNLPIFKYVRSPHRIDRTGRKAMGRSKQRKLDKNASRKICPRRKRVVRKNHP
jgi:hypothetical protein